jgi:hypothetical protein
MAGDEKLPRAQFQATRAISIAAPPCEVYQWIVQVGFGRAGFYSYALLDSLGHHSAERIVPELQAVNVGDWVPMSPTVNETTVFEVDSMEPPVSLLWRKPDSTWAWRLDPAGELRRRNRHAWSPGGLGAVCSGRRGIGRVIAALVGRADFMQQREQLVAFGLCQDTEYAGGALAACGVELVKQAPAGGSQFHQRGASVRQIVAARHESGNLRAIHDVGNCPRHDGEALSNDRHPQRSGGQQPHQPGLRAGKTQGCQRFPGTLMQSSGSAAE